MRSAARRLDMALAAHAVRCHASPRGSLASPPRVGGRGRWEESPSRGVSIHRRAFSSDAPATSPNAPPPVTHLLTAYDMSAAPAMQVTPLRLAGTGAERPGELGSRLWRAIRLARDVRREGVGSAPELFAPAPRSWGEGVALRLGARGAVTDAVEASLRAENAAFALAEEPTRALDEATLRAQPETRAAYAALLREALYAHAAAAVAPGNAGFEVSRTRDDGVRLVETSSSAPSQTDCEAPQTAFETAIDLADCGASGFLQTKVRLVASARARARRSSRTVRDLLDSPDPALRATARSGLEVVAIGGPPLVGTLLLEGDAGDAPGAGAVGEPRAELNGDSLLEYHRKRYPARVDALRGADPEARAVWLVPGTLNQKHKKHNSATFGGPMAYPAELLAPTAPVLDFEDFETSASPYDARTTQARVTALRAALGQPFVSSLGDDAFLAERMTRLTEPTLVASGPCGRLVLAGSAASGPAVPPRADVDARASPKLVLVPAFLLSQDAFAQKSRGKEEADAFAAEETARLRARLADGVAAAHEAWSVPSAATRATRDDLRAAEAATWDEPRAAEGNRAETLSSLERLERALRSAARKGVDRVLVETGGSAALESAVREACASARLPAPRRCAFEASARELALELGATRGGQASTFPGFAAAQSNLLEDLPEAEASSASSASSSIKIKGTVFVGVSGVPGLAGRRGEHAEDVVVAVVDENAAVLFDGARARRLRARRAYESAAEESSKLRAGKKVLPNESASLLSEESHVALSEDGEDDVEGDADGSAREEEGDASYASASYASASRLAGAAAASAALEAFAPGTPRRLVAHHDGKSHPFFRDAFASVAAARGVPSVDVVDVERDSPSSVTGRVLQWDKEHGVDAPARGNTWALSETRAVAVTAGDVSKNRETFLARPLFLRRVAGATDALTIAREVVALAETRVDGFGGAHAMPVTLRGGGWQTRVLMV